MNRTWVACWADDALNLQPSIECTWVGSFLISINGMQFVAGFSEFVLGGMLVWCSRSATIYGMHMSWKLFDLHQWTAVCRKKIQCNKFYSFRCHSGLHWCSKLLLRPWFWCICNHDGHVPKHGQSVGTSVVFRIWCSQHSLSKQRLP